MLYRMLDEEGGKQGQSEYLYIVYHYTHTYLSYIHDKNRHAEDQANLTKVPQHRRVMSRAVDHLIPALVI